MNHTINTLTRDDLEARVNAVPRVKLAHLPTPLEHCRRLSESLGGPDIYVKRDDLTGLAFGGNKTRQLEFLFADIASKEADIVVAGAYTQSNWCRQITAAASKLGLDVALVLIHGEKGPARQGNLLLDDLMGADITVASPKGGEAPIDPTSQKDDWQTDATRRFNEDAAVREKFANTVKLSDVAAEATSSSQKPVL